MQTRRAADSGPQLVCAPGGTYPRSKPGEGFRLTLARVGGERPPVIVGRSEAHEIPGGRADAVRFAEESSVECGPEHGSSGPSAKEGRHAICCARLTLEEKSPAYRASSLKRLVRGLGVPAGTPESKSGWYARAIGPDGKPASYLLHTRGERPRYFRGQLETLERSVDRLHERTPRAPVGPTMKISNHGTPVDPVDPGEGLSLLDPVPGVPEKEDNLSHGVAGVVGSGMKASGEFPGEGRRVLEARTPRKARKEGLITRPGELRGTRFRYPASVSKVGSAVKSRYKKSDDCHVASNAAGVWGPGIAATPQPASKGTGSLRNGDLERSEGRSN